MGNYIKIDTNLYDYCESVGAHQAFGDIEYY